MLVLLACGEKGQKKIQWTEEDRSFLLAELSRTSELLELEVMDLHSEQADFKTSDDSWSIKDIVEHLEVQNELHYREVSSQSRGPELPAYSSLCTGRDSVYQAYSTNPKKGKAGWYMEPIGRFKDLDEALKAFLRAREHFAQFITQTPSDLRNHFTFKAGKGDLRVNELVPGDVRDLHQLVLTGIAHTERHVNQIREIKNHPEFPENETQENEH